MMGTVAISLGGCSGTSDNELKSSAISAANEDVETLTARFNCRSEYLFADSVYSYDEMRGSLCVMSDSRNLHARAYGSQSATVQGLEDFIGLDANQYKFLIDDRWFIFGPNDVIDDISAGTEATVVNHSTAAALLLRFPVDSATDARNFCVRWATSLIEANVSNRDDFYDSEIRNTRMLQPEVIEPVNAIVGNGQIWQRLTRASSIGQIEFQQELGKHFAPVKEACATAQPK